jgi:hypothetical protein
MKRASRLVAGMVFALALGAAPQADATIFNYVVPLSGANEVPGGSGDPDGTGTATLVIDDVADTISWSIVVANIDTVILDHIHTGAAGVNGSVIIDFGGVLVGGPIVDPDVDAVVANPLGHYVNVHTNTFPGGAIRGQVPEPTTLLLFGTGLLGLAVASRRRPA